MFFRVSNAFFEIYVAHIKLFLQEGRPHFESTQYLWDHQRPTPDSVLHLVWNHDVEMWLAFHARSGSLTPWTGIPVCRTRDATAVMSGDHELEFHNDEGTWTRQSSFWTTVLQDLDNLGIQMET